MNDKARSIQEWRESKGFTTPDGIEGAKGTEMLGKLMLVVTEVAEAAEAVRSNDLENFTEELADTFIRLLDITSTMGIDIEEAIASKMLVNHGREHLHGRQSIL